MEQTPEEPPPITESPSEDPIEMHVKGLMLDPSSNAPIVVLHDGRDGLLLPIWIGAAEANAIALRLEGMSSPRPMTHDLLHAAIESLGGEVDKVEIVDLQESTFYAHILIRGVGEAAVRLDSRPSDAVALALRSEAPIFVARKVLEKADAFALAASELTEEDRMRRQLEELDADEPGKYTM